MYLIYWCMITKHFLISEHHKKRFLSTIGENKPRNAYLRHSPAVTSRKKRSRRRGKRGVLVRIKAHLRSACKSGPCFHSRVFSAARQPLWLRWIQPVVPDHPIVGLFRLPLETPLPRRSRVRSGGVDFRHLHPLARTSKPDHEEIILRLALLNAKSLANKTFVLNDFFTSRELDFMLLTETWLHVHPIFRTFSY